MKLRNIKRIIGQFIETEYWYRWRKWNDYWYDSDEKKYIKVEKKARDSLTCTWDGENDILMMMRMKIEHQFYNLKHDGCQASFYLDSYSIIDKGTNADKLTCLFWLLNEYDLLAEKDLPYVVHREKYNDGSFSNAFCIGGDENKTKYLVHMYYLNGNSSDWFLLTKEKGKEDIKTYLEFSKGIFCSLDLNNQRDKEIVDGVIKYVYTINVPVDEYNKLSQNLKQEVRGLRRVLTDLLCCRHIIKQLYNLNDTNDKYFNMWKDIEDKELCNKKLKEAMELYNKDRCELYHKLADFMAKNGNGWWD